MKRSHEDDEQVSHSKRFRRSTSPHDCHQRSCIQLLSDEILLQVMSHLPAKALARAQLVSRRWDALATEPVLWKVLFERDFATSALVSACAARRRAVGAPENGESHASVPWRALGHISTRDLARSHAPSWKLRYRVRARWASGKCTIRPVPHTTKHSFVTDSYIVTAQQQGCKCVLHIQHRRTSSMTKIDLHDVSDGVSDIVQVIEPETGLLCTRTPNSVDIFRLVEHGDQTICECIHRLREPTNHIACGRSLLATLTGKLFRLYALEPGNATPRLLHTLRGDTVGDRTVHLTQQASGCSVATIIFMTHGLLHSDLNLQQIRVTANRQTVEVVHTSFPARRPGWTGIAVTPELILTSHDDNTLTAYTYTSSDAEGGSLAVTGSEIVLAASAALSGCGVDTDKYIGVGRAGLIIRPSTPGSTPTSVRLTDQPSQPSLQQLSQLLSCRAQEHTVAGVVADPDDANAPQILKVGSTNVILRHTSGVVMYDFA
ncbi:hypothetical protein PYCC9005_003121 [Savitreella phatthalungensis]